MRWLALVTFIGCDFYFDDKQVPPSPPEIPPDAYVAHDSGPHPAVCEVTEPSGWCSHHQTGAACFYEPDVVCVCSSITYDWRCAKVGLDAGMP